MLHFLTPLVLSCGICSLSGCPCCHLILDIRLDGVPHLHHFSEVAGSFGLELLHDEAVDHREESLHDFDGDHHHKVGHHQVGQVMSSTYDCANSRSSNIVLNLSMVLKLPRRLGSTSFLVQVDASG